ncbi:MAG: molybdenum cofactor biosynthesis protein MoaE [Gammaproteobacteria bacterium]|nr:molybdenum cofactor biosynthesis protein MoaE [Gammaproteobacteria bacterium]
MRLTVRIQSEDFDVGRELALIEDAGTDVGGVVSFTGRVRGAAAGSDVTALEIEHYPGMTERSVEAVAAQAGERWPLAALTVIHRVGRLEPGAQIVLVLTASRHRQAAFDGARFVMDYLKTRAVFWKREIYPDGSCWVESRADDHAAASSWGVSGR